MTSGSTVAKLRIITSHTWYAAYATLALKSGPRHHGSPLKGSAAAVYDMNVDGADKHGERLAGVGFCRHKMPKAFTP
jgi:hypothetical protein